MSILNKAILTGGLVMGVAFSAMAHPELKSSVPQADSAVAAPEKIQLNFSENLTVKFSGAKLTMTGMKGMSSHSPMPVAAKVAPGADPKSMVIIPREPLPAGTYRVDWRAVSSDTHPITGMNDLIMIVIRFLLYLDLMVIFGLPFFQIYGISGVRHETYNLTNFRSFITFAVVTGIILTGINMLLVSNAMSGVTDLRELSIHVIEMVIEETDVGISWIVRLCALFTTLGALFLYTNKRVLSCLLMTMSGGVALATLAWGGHAVMHDGLHYYLHLLSDLTHLGAAGAWTGALVAFAILLMRRNEHNAQSVIVISDSLAKFATAGTVIVVALILSALVNYLYIAEGNLTPLFNSSWGRILLAKTALFVLMLLLAAANRFHLGPRLEVMVREGNYDRSVALMRNSILTEFVVAIIILGAVAWLGMLAPSQIS
ncbi:copper resistant protein PcoD [Klebsiella pneumoniae]|nr:copper resistant protein PcoD [Klebsiella pneumoniae]